MIKNFIDFYKININEEKPPLTFYLLESSIVENIEHSFIKKYAECIDLKSKGYVCYPFYKKISRYE